MAVINLSWKAPRVGQSGRSLPPAAINAYEIIAINTDNSEESVSEVTPDNATTGAITVPDTWPGAFITVRAILPGNRFGEPSPAIEVPIADTDPGLPESPLDVQTVE